MPLYEYRCRDCSLLFEVLQASGQGGDSLECPQCGAANPSKKFSTFASRSAGDSASKSAVSSATGCGPGGFT